MAELDDVSAADFDQLFAAARSSAALKATVRTGFPDLPDWVDTFSFVPAVGMNALADDLGMTPGDTLLDVACGLGGPGLFVAQRLSVRLVGIDWSRTAVEAALATASAVRPDAAFSVASGSHLPVRDASVDGAICIDALPFLPGFGLLEILRVLRPGARLAFTAWERDSAPEPLLAVSSYRDLLESEGFVVEHATYHPEWLEMQRSVYLEAQRRHRSGEADEAVSALAEEADAFLRTLADDRRVAVVARRPVE